MENQIDKLNKKIWYRLLKVIFVIIILGLTTISFIYIFITYKPIKKSVYDETLILCDNGKKFSLERVNCEREEQISLLNRVCLEGIKCRENSESLSLKERIQKKFAIEKEDRENNYVKLFKLEEQFKIVQENSWSQVILFWFISLCIIMFIVEIIRRIFYYIITGHFNIRKN